MREYSPGANTNVAGPSANSTAGRCSRFSVMRSSVSPRIKAAYALAAVIASRPHNNTDPASVRRPPGCDGPGPAGHGVLYVKDIDAVSEEFGIPIDEKGLAGRECALTDPAATGCASPPGARDHQRPRIVPETLTQAALIRPQPHRGRAASRAVRRSESCGDLRRCCPASTLLYQGVDTQRRTG